MSNDRRLPLSVAKGPTTDQVGSCSPDQHGHCATCSDEALPAKVLRVDQATGLALVAVQDSVTEVDISLVEQVAPGDLLLVHGGVALERLEESSDDQPGRL